MIRKRYLVIKVAYEPDSSYERSLMWIAPELCHASLRLLEDRDDEARGVAHVRAGIVEDATNIRAVREGMAP